MPSLPAPNADLPKPGKCRPILESLCISASVAAQSFIRKREIAVSFARTQISIVHQNKGMKMNAAKREIVRVDEASDRRIHVLYGLTEEEIRIVEGNILT
jgi:hypothetical protein